MVNDEAEKRKDQSGDLLAALERLKKALGKVLSSAPPSKFSRS
jgi:hypothetical protein